MRRAPAFALAQAGGRADCPGHRNEPPLPRAVPGIARKRSAGSYGSTAASRRVQLSKIRLRPLDVDLPVCNSQRGRSFIRSSRARRHRPRLEDHRPASGVNRRASGVDRPEAAVLRPVAASLRPIPARPRPAPASFGRHRPVTRRYRPEHRRLRRDCGRLRPAFGRCRPDPFDTGQPTADAGQSTADTGQPTPGGSFSSRHRRSGRLERSYRRPLRVRPPGDHRGGDTVGSLTIDAMTRRGRMRGRSRRPFLCLKTSRRTFKKEVSCLSPNGAAE